VKAGGELCDGDDFGASTCETATGIPGISGSLKCTSQCLLDTSGCGAGAGCTHDVCTDGEALSSSCDACTMKVCAANEFCCLGAWDLACVESAKTLCSMCL
jgi:hypothetical protein